MNYFHFPRFMRVLLNDLLQVDARRVLFASLGLIALGCLMYFMLADALEPSTTPLANVMFLILLIGGGAIFTSMIFNDMHHPLERFHYLTLPCSTLERFASRYLITAPLFVVYAIVLYLVFESIANLLCEALFNTRVPPLQLGSDMVQEGIRQYFVLHVFLFAGAIWFRSYALIKTMFASFIFFAALGTAVFLAVRTIYWDSFISLFETNPDGPYINLEIFNFGDEDFDTWYEKPLFAAFLLWMLFLAYLGLKEHEVQDGL